MIFVLDNYDSFTYNLVQYIGQFAPDVEVYRNDVLSVEDIRQKSPAGIVISPGPGRPEDAGLSVEIIRELGTDIPILGICLGHQAIATAYGGKVDRAPEVVHGKTSEIQHDGDPLFKGLPSPFRATRYHSLLVDEASLPTELVITARTASGLIMGLRHRKFPVVGMQFHPESILTEHGLQMIENFIMGPS